MGKVPPTRRLLSNEIRKDREAARASRNASPFFGTGMHPNGLGGLDSDNFVTDTSGYRLAETPEFNDIKLRGGIIGNDALSEPVKAVRLHDDVDSFAVTTSDTVILSASTPVPAGYTQVLVLNFAVAVSAYNATAATDFLYANTLINGVNPPGWQIGSTPVSTTGTGVAYQIATDFRSGISGTLTFSGTVSSAYGNWGADSTNVANLDVAMLFLR